MAVLDVALGRRCAASFVYGGVSVPLAKDIHSESPRRGGGGGGGSCDGDGIEGRAPAAAAPASARAIVEVGGNLFMAGTQHEIVASEVMLLPVVHADAPLSVVVSGAFTVLIVVAHIAPMVADRGV
ncbi:hypothetical protein JKP88DRAFT_282463 [Tribonema minus]|uniref:Uncharacterized protein n=1 Tax=Tribonema minus TaxID=303371 RepID=A0A836C8U1_9STRA|nr:hypothetical protein JKP88DRAFT_282463 [Tribonema minus]